MTRSDLGKFVSEQQQLGFERFEGADNGVEGYLLDCSDEWLLIHSVVDFHLDGFTLIRPKDISRIRVRARAFDRILRAEGTTKEQIAACQVLNIFSTESLFKDLKARAEITIVHCEYSDESYLYIGRPKRVNRLSVSMRWFDANGRWQPECVSIPYSTISTIQFDCEYSRVFSRYLQETRIQPSRRNSK